MEKGSLRQQFPDIARIVDEFREQFGDEAGGRLTVDGRVVREWGVWRGATKGGNSERSGGAA